MELGLILLNQIELMFVLMGIGTLMYKKGIISAQENWALSYCTW